MRWRVQLGIDSTMMFGNFAKIGRATSHDYLFIISMTKLHLPTSAYNFEALYPALVSDNSQCEHHILPLPDF